MLSELIFASSDPHQSQKIRRQLREGQLTQLLPRVYTSNLAEAPTLIVRRNLYELIAKLYPASLVSHRSALEFKLTPTDQFYLTGSQRRVLRWPGVTIRVAKGPDPLEDDQPLYPGLYASSAERACLENLLPSRKVNGEKRTVDQEAIGRQLLVILNTRGERGLQAFRDRAREIATEFEWEVAFGELQQLISALLSSGPATALRTPAAKAQVEGLPFDTGRVALFQTLAETLHRSTLPDYPTKTITVSSYQHFAFFESYFSNYIEGTTFTVSQAKEIVRTGKTYPNRYGDSHDIRGTYRVCANRDEMSVIPQTGDELLRLLKKRHAIILRGRPDKLPGIFKQEANRAGDTLFVAPHQVKGTLRKGFQWMQAITSPIWRALYLMFLIAEVHPFADGNGRIARVMMNAELSAGGQTKLIIPTVYRTDYLLNLRKLSRQQQAEGYVRMMLRAWQYSHWIEPTDLDDMEDQFRRTNAFRESDEAVLWFPAG